MNRFVIYRPAMGGRLGDHSLTLTADAATHTHTKRPSSLSLGIGAPANKCAMGVGCQEGETNKSKGGRTRAAASNFWFPWISFFDGSNDDEEIRKEDDCVPGDWETIGDSYLDDLTPSSRALLLNDSVDEPLLLAFRVG